MSSTSPQAAAAGDTAAWQAQLSQMLSGITMPELQKLMESGGLSGMLGSVGANGQMGADAAIKSSATSQLNQGYDQAKTGSREAISYGALRSGEGRSSPGAVSSAITSAATSLDRDRTSALRNLDFQSASSSMTDYNKVLQMLGQGTNTALGLAQGFSGASGAAIGGLSGMSQAGGIIGGAATGAGIGTAINPGWGTAIGAVAGGIYGAVSNP